MPRTAQPERQRRVVQQAGGAVDAGACAPLITTDGGRVSILDRADLGRQEIWQRVFAGRCKDHRYYELLVDCLGCKFAFFFLLIEAPAGKPIGIQPVFLVRQDLVEAAAAWQRAAVNRLRGFWPGLLMMPMLMVGCAAGESHPGIADPANTIPAMTMLREFLDARARDLGASVIVLKDFPPEYREVLGNWARHGYSRVPSMPLTRLRLSFRAFDEYLATLGKATRKDLRRKLRKIESAGGMTLELRTDVSDLADELHPLYLQVHERSPLKFERLTPEFLRQIGQRLPDRTRFFIWRHHGRIVAFSLCLVHGGTLYDEYLGLDYAVALDLHLYFHTFRDIVEWAIAERLEWYVSSPLNYRPKLHLGCELGPLDCHVKHTQPMFRPVFGRLASLFGPTRNEPVLRQFPNAGDL